jgi:Asp-tRNA(Asn)/Glu-tRNA(Gln) amidotransferase B subunit
VGLCDEIQTIVRLFIIIKLVLLQGWQAPAAGIGFVHQASLVQLDRIQLEQDTGKTTTSERIYGKTKENDEDDDVSTTTITATTSISYSEVDYNRAGIGLIEFFYRTRFTQ